jgi:hypothetical protein
MEFSTTHDYPAGLDRLWAAFGQPGYPRQKYLALGARLVRLDRFDACADTIDVDLERVVSLDTVALPAWTRHLLGDAQTLRHRTAWRRVSPHRVEACLDIVPLGLPVQARGTGSIDELPAGTSRMRLSWRVDSRLPVLGARVERIFADQVRAALDEDHRFTLGLLRQTAPARQSRAPRRTGATARR